MTMSRDGCALDRPIWHALRSAQARLAEGGPLALRYQCDHAPFAAARDDTPESMAALGQLIPADRAVYLLQTDVSAAPPGTMVETVAEGVQMLVRTMAMPDAPDRAVRLGPDDAPAMRDLATLTKPGPFLAKTHLLGDFFGIKEHGRLVAMAGERMRLDGLTEVSGVCTHPDAQGQGFGRFLTQLMAARIAARGETPFLHAYASNVNAIRLYETLGFVLRRMMMVTVLRRLLD